MIRSIFFMPGKPTRKDIPTEEFPRLTREKRGLLWIDFVSEPLETILTIITTLFMPLTFVTGLFGMNFFAANPHYENWTQPTIFYGTLSLILLTPIIMFFWIRRRTWV